MQNRRQLAHTGEVVSFHVTEEAVYLKVAVSDEHDRHMGWAKGVKIDKATLAQYVKWIESRMNEAMQLTLPWGDERDELEDSVRWLPPKP